MLYQWKQIHKKNKESFEAKVQKQRQHYVAAAVAILVAWPYSTCGGGIIFCHYISYMSCFIGSSSLRTDFTFY